MAQMRPAAFPATVNKEARESREKDAYELLAKNLPGDAIALYEPTIFGKGGIRKYPDFILLHPSFGVVAMEVKNWNLDKITDVDTNRLSRRLGDSGMKVQVTHPFKQSRQHGFALSESIVRDLAKYPEVVNADGPHAGKIRFPVLSIVVFMGTKEVDMDRLISVFNKTLTPEDVLTEEALSNPALLLWRLQGIPKVFKGTTPGADILEKIADSLIPPAASDSERIRLEDRKGKILLPRTVHQLSKPAAGEDELAAYNRLRADLQGVAEDLFKLIDADKAGSVRADMVKKILDEVKVDEFRVGLFGETAAGKSTFINALFGRKLLPQANGETTKTLTRIRKPFGSHKPKQATITYKTIKELNRETLEYLLADAFVNIDRESFSLTDKERMTQLRTLAEQPPGPDAGEAMAAAHKFLKALVAGWEKNVSKLGTTVTMDLEASTELCHVEGEAVFIKSRDIYIDHPFTRERFVFVDSPGVGSSLARHTNLAVETARDVDAAAMIINAQRPVMGADKDFFRKVKTIRDPDTLDNYFFVLNKISAIDPEQVGAPDFPSAVKQQCDRVREKLREDGIKNAPVIPVEAQCALLAQLVTNKEGCDPTTRKQWVDASYCLEDKKADFPDPEKNLKASGFLNMVSRLKDHLSKVKTVGFLGAKHTHLRQATDAFSSDIQKEIEDLDSTLESLRKENDAHKIAKGHAKNKIDEHLKYVFSGKVDEIVQDIRERAIEMTHGDIKNLMLDIVQKNAKRYFTTATEKGEDFWSSVFHQNNLGQDVEKLVTSEQSKFIAEYRQLRESISTDLVTNIVVKEYGEKLGWNFEYRPLPVNASDPIQSIYKLNLGLYQSAKTSIARFINTVVGKFGPEEWIDVNAMVIEAMGENFMASCSNEIAATISEWLEKDCEEFKRATTESFDRLMQAIDEGIVVRMESIGSKTKEREARSSDLQHYRAEIDSTMEKLGELKNSIAKLNPR